MVISEGEKICRKNLEIFYKGKKFENVKLEKFINPITGFKLELDCYNEELKLAVEYNGKQHYVYPNDLHKNEIEFLEQIKRDKEKKKLCDQYGIYLIIVPYTIPFDQIASFILKNLPPD